MNIGDSTEENPNGTSRITLYLLLLLHQSGYCSSPRGYPEQHTQTRNFNVSISHTATLMRKALIVHTLCPCCLFFFPAFVFLEISVFVTLLKMNYTW